MVVVLATALAAPARAAAPESCVLVYPVAARCTYVATQVASWVGNGPFHLRVSYTATDGRRRTRYAVDQPSGTATSVGTTDALQIGIGDTVEGEVGGPGAFLAIGNPGASPHGPPSTVEAARLAGDVTPVHDPDIVKSGGWYYVYSTGAGIPIRRSRDLVHWERVGQVFASGADIWAPDLSFFAGRWHLYYAMSTFGSKRASIGLATNATLDPSDPRYAWRDQGAVVDSRELTDPSGLPTDYVAIDPNIVMDRRGHPHLVFGSFYGGLKTLRLNAETGRPVLPLAPVPLATNVQEYTGVEASYMVERRGWYYLFASYDYCCRGVDSTYNVRVGRARSVDGPFVDDHGVPMLAGGGRYVLASHGDMRGPGHNSILRRGDRYDIVFHWYDGANGGTPTLGILPLKWKDGWPSV